jgi:hypothetical protein
MQLDSSTIQSMILVGVLLYGAFLGYCAGRAKGYDEGSKMVMEVYGRK